MSIVPAILSWGVGAWNFQRIRTTAILLLSILFDMSKLLIYFHFVTLSIIWKLQILLLLSHSSVYLVWFSYSAVVQHESWTWQWTGLQRGLHVNTKSTIFWAITLCSPLKVSRCFGGTCRLHLPSPCWLSCKHYIIICFQMWPWSWKIFHIITLLIYSTVDQHVKISLLIPALSLSQTNFNGIFYIRILLHYF
jgi:hypothetical protein